MINASRLSKLRCRVLRQGVSVRGARRRLEISRTKATKWLKCVQLVTATPTPSSMPTPKATGSSHQNAAGFVFVVRRKGGSHECPATAPSVIVQPQDEINMKEPTGYGPFFSRKKGVEST